MTLPADIFEALSGDMTLAALVSTRIYPQARPPKDDLPCVTYFRVSKVPAVHHEGWSMATHRYQFTCWASTRLAAEDVALALERAVQSVGRASIIVGGNERFEPDTEVYATVVEAEIFQEE